MGNSVLDLSQRRKNKMPRAKSTGRKLRGEKEKRNKERREDREKRNRELRRTQ